MHAEHAALLDQLRAAGRPRRSSGLDLAAYAGTTHPMLDLELPTAGRRAIARAWAASHKTMAPTAVWEVVESLLDGPSFDEKTLGLLLLDDHRAARTGAGPVQVEAWLDRLVGWAEVDSLCQSLFGPEHLLAHWPAWEALIRRLAGDGNINKRRASLVLLTKPVHRSPDVRVRDLAFETIERLKAERPILITKAVSWLLRAMTTHHADRVAAYLQAEGATLPKIAVRETRTKLATGHKLARA